MTRKQEPWSCHDKRHQGSPGTPFQAAAHMGTMQQSCIRCGVHRSPAALESDKQIKYQKRRIDRELCATARGGKS
jgi:hypothetical protein